GRAAHGLQRGTAEGRRASLPARGGDGQGLHVRGGAADRVRVRGSLRRLWLHPGVPGREVLPGGEARHDLRGDDQHAAAAHREAAMAKLYRSEAAQRIASGCVDLFGDYGFTREYPVEKFYRDAKNGTIYEGTTNMQLQTIAKALLK